MWPLGSQKWLCSMEFW